MKKELDTIETVKKELEKIKGENVKMLVNRGRKRITKFDAQITNIYPSIFTVMILGEERPERSYSYTEVLCGNVKICPKNVL